MTDHHLDRLVLATRIMHLTVDQSLGYIRRHLRPISRRYYLQRLHDLQENATRRIHAIATDFEDLHMGRIDTLRTVEAELWRLYHADQQVVTRIKTKAKSVNAEGKPIESIREEPKTVEVETPPEVRAKILHEIAVLQPLISAYEEATRDIIEEGRAKRQQEPAPAPALAPPSC